jgi:prophage antirepressor-like protein
MNAMTTFDFQEQPVRSLVGEDGEPWFVARDVCGALQIAQPESAYRRLEDDEKGMLTVQTPGGAQLMTCVSEAGCYRLVFTSRTEKAEAFKRWLAHEVLPAIRRTGHYMMPDAEMTETSVEDPVLIAGHDPSLQRDWLNIVREGGRLYGKAVARSLWLQSPLPKAEGMYALPVPAVEAPAASSTVAFIRDSIRKIGGRTLDAAALWRAYTDWCLAREAARESQTALGRAMTEAGITRVKAGRIFYQDVALAG